MCFTVAIMRNGVLMIAEEYYRTRPIQKKKAPPMPEIPDLFFVSGFQYPALPIIKSDSIELHRWGLIPSDTKTVLEANRIKGMTHNARNDTIFEKKSYRQNIRSHRALLPVSGFYEYRDIDKIKYPYYISPADAPGFLLGTIYDSWVNTETGEITNTFSIITTDANPLMEMIHNIKKRMPLILSYDNAEKWLDPNISREQIKSLMVPYDEKQMKAHTISRVANQSKANRNFKEIMDEVHYPEIDQKPNLLF